MENRGSKEELELTREKRMTPTNPANHHAMKQREVWSMHFGDREDTGSEDLWVDPKIGTTCSNCQVQKIPSIRWSSQLQTQGSMSNHILKSSQIQPIRPNYTGLDLSFTSTRGLRIRTNVHQFLAFAG